MDALLAGRYRRVRLLGRGAMGEVWLAEDELLHRTVAVKTVLRAGDAEHLERIVREARLTARLNHPHAVAVHDLVVENAQPHVVMAYVAGRTLADEIRTTGGLPPGRVREIGVGLADALAEAHRLGIVHRDVKPANVLINERGVPTLADFGIARSDATSGASSAGVLGTPSFVAPEVVRGARADGAADVWSLGATLYAALEGRSPFVQRDDDSVWAVLHRVASDPVPPPTRDQELGAVIMGLLQRDPAARPDAAAAAARLRGLAAARADLDITVPPDAANTAPGGPRRRSRQRVLLSVVAVAVLVAALVTAALATGGTGDRDGGTSSRRAGPSQPAPSSVVPTGTSTYAAPGGIIVRAPAGWVADDSAGIANVRDYRAPGTRDRATGTYFRIGIANPAPADDIRQEARGTQRALASGDTPYELLTQQFLTFLGSPAVDQEYRGTNGDGEQRRFVLRLWFHAGRTLEIELNTPTDEYEQRFGLFEQLASSCQLT